MLTHLYWLCVVIVVFGSFYLVAVRLGQVKAALVVAVVLGVISHSFYYFYLEQLLVKRYGGTMSLTQPAGTYHMGMTWKDDHLWIQSYDPRTNECLFREYSRGSVLQGEVRVRQCNPVHQLRDQPIQQHTAPLIERSGAESEL